MNRNYYYILPIILQKAGHCLFFILYKLFVHLEVIGREHIRGVETPIILAPNHTSELDVTALPMVLPFFSSLRPIYFVMNPERKLNTFGWRSYIYGSGFLTLLGGYPIQSGYRDYSVSLERHIDLLKKGRTVCIFPEGQRTEDGRYSRARGGLGYMVHVSGATVIPITIDTFFGLSWWDFLLRRKKITIKIGRPIKAGELIPSDLQDPDPDDFRRIAQNVLDKSEEMMGKYI